MEASSRPRPRSNISTAWDHFVRQGTARGSSAHCSHCGLEVAVPCGSTTGMFSHLQKHHPEQYRDAKMRQRDRFDVSARYLYPTLCQENTRSHGSKAELPLRPDNQAHYTKADPRIRPDNPAHYTYPEEPEIVLIKANDINHLAKSICPELDRTFKSLISTRLEMKPASGHDVTILCSDGLLPAHKLILSSSSRFLRSLFTWRDHDHLYLLDYKMSDVSSLLEYLYTGVSELSEEGRQLAEYMGVSVDVEEVVDEDIEEPGDPLATSPAKRQHILIKEEIYDNEDVDEDLNEDEYGANPEPVVEITPDFYLEDLAPSARGFPSSQQLLVPRYQDFELEKRAMELKDKIFAECSRISALKSGRKPSRLPSKIWMWFDKNPTTVTCKVCGTELRNCGNTTNAACHLRKHPQEFREFRRACGDSDLDKLDSFHVKHSLDGITVGKTGSAMKKLRPLLPKPEEIGLSADFQIKMEPDSSAMS